MFTQLRLTWRLQRWEIAVLIGGPLVLAATATFLASQISATDTGAIRLAELAPIILGATTVVPFVVGLLLGAPLIAREIEKRTAPMAWSLSTSRARWIGQRAIPLLVAIGIALLILGQATEALVLATPPGKLGFGVLAMHGPLVAARGVAVFCIGVLVGLVVGRTLPAILVTGLLTILLLGGLTFARSELMRAEATWISADEAGYSGVVSYDQAYLDDATGERLSFDEVYLRYPDVFGPTGTGIPPGMRILELTTPQSLYPVFVAREIGALLAVSVLAAGASVWLLRSRRPS
jgi:ABC-type transport system involved in multi-copper enzyme maturation permease subunit